MSFMCVCFKLTEWWLIIFHSIYSRFLERYDFKEQFCCRLPTVMLASVQVVLRTWKPCLLKEACYVCFESTAGYWKRNFTTYSGFDDFLITSPSHAKCRWCKTKYYRKMKKKSALKKKQNLKLSIHRRSRVSDLVRATRSSTLRKIITKNHNIEVPEKIQVSSQLADILKILSIFVFKLWGSLQIYFVLIISLFH